ncbi:AAA family ATPase [Emcibacter nanhaiensis]|uniref:MoxR family ATPase n=1 Tax=Emcibacter nanhaiensis TaxID=1505037 RepID=A0A501PJC9_9PROT|nr:MoxR family ATPase [Emcibacter nanhaiensis]TPD60148.1 MoxR family ATPase [Emcibacter nanhaiensis]
MSSVQEYRQYLEQGSYVAEDVLATALYMAEKLSRPLLLEGEAGVGKTFVASALAEAMGRKLIRLQCYEGLDATQAIYEWNYQRQILTIAKKANEHTPIADKDLFSEDFLLKRPLLQAITQDISPILLIDEIDRADEEFEAFLLELLAEYQISIPEYGVVKAKTIPLVILTSNGTRELSDALRRRCLYHYIDYPDAGTELRIVRKRMPDCPESLASQIVNFIQTLRKEDLKKTPGIAETLDWTAALVGLNVRDLGDDVELIHNTLLCVLKTREDIDALPVEIVSKLIAKSA